MGKQRVTRRQFLNYTLTGVGGFMAAGILMPMFRFSVDPLLKHDSSGDYVLTDLKMSDITTEPTRVSFSFEQKDAWYTSDVTNTAWVFKNDDGEILALSPVCTHLGCTVDWNTNKDFPNQFYCPCHQGRYKKDGTNIAGTPPTRPLDVYPYKEVDGYLALGMKAKQRKEA